MKDIELIHGDSLQALRGYGDNHFDVAIVDPEFGINIGHSPRLVTDKGLKAKDWDIKPIDHRYFDELFRVSKNQIVWGGNYYALPATKHCIVWDKMQPESMSFGMFDFAWTSYSGANKMFRSSVLKEKNKIHPTQKPVTLYKWLLHNYTKENDLILDTHLGSGSIAIACHYMKRKLIAYEIDSEYYENACKRFKEQTAQQALW